MAQMHPCRVLFAALAAVALTFGAAAHAVVYKWVEDDGRVIYSNELPADPAKVRELSRIDDLELIPADKHPALAAPPQSSRTGESAATTTAPVTLIPREAPQRPSPELTIVKPAEPPARRSREGVTALQRDSATVLSREPVTLLGREPVTLLPKDPAPAAADGEPPLRVIPRSTHTDAVQDPCLVSPDPRCHERHKNRYHPYLGYSPGGPVAQAVGASSSVAAGGAVGGAVATQAIVPPKRGAQHALHPGSALPAPTTGTRIAR